MYTHVLNLETRSTLYYSSKGKDSSPTASKMVSGEVALMIQTLQAASYSGTFIWKIPEMQRRGEAKSGRTLLCSILHESPWIQDVPV